MTILAQSDNEFTFDIAWRLSQSSEKFPVDFDLAWAWIGYKAKRNAKEVLLNNFEENEDFLRSTPKTSQSGRPREIIRLSVDCFKSLGMMAGTDNGKLIRRHFLNCERRLKEVLSNPSEARLDTMQSEIRDLQLGMQQVLGYLQKLDAKLEAIALPQPQQSQPPMLESSEARDAAQRQREKSELHWLNVPGSYTRKSAESTKRLLGWD